MCVFFFLLLTRPVIFVLTHTHTRTATRKEQGVRLKEDALRAQRSTQEGGLTQRLAGDTTIVQHTADSIQ